MTGDWLPLLPQLILFAGGALILGGSRLRPHSRVWGTAAFLVVLAASVCLYQQSRSQGLETLPGIFATAVNVAFLFSAGVLVLGDGRRNDETRCRGETHGIVLCGVACAMLVAVADDVIPLFILLELCGFAATALGEPGVRRQALILQFVSAALLLLAVLLIGIDQRLADREFTTNLLELRRQFAAVVQSGTETGLSRGPSSIARGAFVLMFAAVAMKALLVPFHFGAPDILMQSSTTASAYTLTVLRGAAFVVLFRVGLLTFAGFESPGLVVSAVLSGATMVIGTALAVGRERLRDTLTYLLIGQGGAVLFGLCVAWGRATTVGAQPPVTPFLTRGETAAGLTLLAASLSVLGIFSLLNHLRTDDRPVEYVEELAGLLRDRPLVATAFAVLLLNLVGVPPLPGFWSRLVTLTSAMAVSKQPLEAFPTPHPAFLILAVAMGIQILITAGVLFRIVAVMLFEPPVSRSRAAGGFPALATGIMCAALIVAIGFLPSRTISTLNSVIPEPDKPGTKSSPSAGTSRSVRRGANPASGFDTLRKSEVFLEQTERSGYNRRQPTHRPRDQT